MYIKKNKYSSFFISNFFENIFILLFIKKYNDIITFVNFFVWKWLTITAMRLQSNEIQRQLIIEKDKEIEELIRKVISLPCEKKSIFINFLFYRIMNFKKRIEI